ncbi:MAG: hypothetical protein H6Q21_1093 [Bacteroidetes bacterium]|nr:hypothetical protein [Bacteroidota bacterium]
MKKILIIAMIIGFPVMVFSQGNKQPAPNVKKMTITKHVYEKGEKVYKELEVKYDAKGNVIEETENNEGIFVMHFVYQYDAAGNKIKETEMDAAGKVKKITEYKYNSSNLRTEKLVYDASHKLKSKRVYQYESY